MEESKAVEKVQYKKTTAGMLGKQFPVQPQAHGGVAYTSTTFSFIEWTLEVEEKIAEFKSKAGGVGQFVSAMLGYLFDDFCGKSFQSYSKEQQTLILNQLEFPNVMYAYIMLRIEELGHDLRLDVTCPTCKKQNKDYVADLRTLEVRVKDKECERVKDYELVRPILHGSKPITGIRLDVSRWAAMEKAGTEAFQNEGKLKKLLLENSVAGFLHADGPSKEFNDISSVLKKMKKVDIEMCMKATMENNAGPHMATSGKCIHCGAEWAKALDWGYEYFFDSSSL